VMEKYIDGQSWFGNSVNRIPNQTDVKTIFFILTTNHQPPKIGRGTVAVDRQQLDIFSTPSGGSQSNIN
jgi:hypothetical protein